MSGNQNCDEGFALRSVPNPAILDAADAFRNGATHLLPHVSSGVDCLRPLMSNAAIAIELYFKSLKAQTKFEQLGPGPDECYWGTSHPENKRQHRLTVLFGELDETHRIGIESAFKASEWRTQRPGKSLVDALEVFDDLFMRSRYSFERKERLPGPLPALIQLMELIGEYVRSITPHSIY